MLAITNCDIYTGAGVEHNKAILVDGDRIQNVLPASEIPIDVEQMDLKGRNIAPGFIDVQVNGGGGILFNDMPEVAGISTIVKSHRRYGTTDLLPTFITGPEEGMRRAASAVKEYLDSNEEGVLGIHFEGPFISAEKAGVHDKAFIREVSEDDLNIIRSLKKGKTLLTLAPEVVPLKVLAELVESPILVSIGHTNAGFEECLMALESGATCTTHLFNAMSGFTSRAPGAVGAALDHADSWVGIIVDGFHVDFASVRVAIRAKASKYRMMLVTDAMPPVGDPKNGGFQLGDYSIKVEGGKCVTGDGVLAGSALDMATGVRNCIQKVGLPTEEALRMASTYPAEFLGLGDELGRIAPGYRANMVVFNNQIQVSASVVGGVFYEAD